MVDIVISNVRISRTRSVYAAFTDNLHHGINADLLASNWGIGLYKSNHTLQPTTQDILISDQKPLTWRYRTDFLLRRICQPNCRFYTDTLFEKDRSIVSHTCTQIFTDGMFVQITPMRSKSDDGMTLDSINCDIGVEDEICMTNYGPVLFK